MGPLKFYWECLKLAWGAAGWARTVNGTLTIFAPLIIYGIPTTELFKEKLPHAYAWLQGQPNWITWIPLCIFLSFFFVRLLLAPYWLYRDKAEVTRKVSPEQAKELQELFRAGQNLYTQRVQSNADLMVWGHSVKEWEDETIKKLHLIDPGESFSFESIGFEYRQSQDLREDAQYNAIRDQLNARLQKLRLITGRHSQGSANAKNAS